MLEKLRGIEEKYIEIEKRLADPSVYGDVSQYAKLAKEQKELEPVVAAYRAYKKAADTADEARALLDEGSDDADFKELLREELDAAKADMGPTVKRTGSPSFVSSSTSSPVPKRLRWVRVALPSSSQDSTTAQTSACAK